MFGRKEPQPPIIIPEPHLERIPPVLQIDKIDKIEKAISYIAGYCRKHGECNEKCRLYDSEDVACMFFDVSAGPPCDWKLPKREED